MRAGAAGSREDLARFEAPMSPLVRRYLFDMLLAEVDWLERDAKAASDLFTRRHAETLGRHARALGRAPIGGLRALTGFPPHPRARERSIRPTLADVPHDPALLDRHPRLLVDLTPSARRPWIHGGIPRVARELARAAVETGLGLGVEVERGQLVSYYRDAALAGPLAFRPGDVYVVGDIFWYFMDEYAPVIAEARRCGATVALVVHDIYPLSFPSFFPEAVPERFLEGLRRFLPLATHCLSVSASSAREVEACLRTLPPALVSHLRFGAFRLGAERKRRAVVPARPAITGLSGPRPLFLSVGKLEPRKGHDITLDACDMAWARGLDFTLVLVATPGWRARALRDRIESHPELGKRLVLLQDVSDADLTALYAGCRALVHSAICEGFGLPVVEACAEGAPVIAGDLPVFHEIEGGSFTFVPVADHNALADALADHLAAPRQPRPVAVQSWATSIRQLAAHVLSASGAVAEPAP